MRNKSIMQGKIAAKIKKSSVPEIIGIAVGAIGGFIYYKTVGSSTGACPITSNPWLTIIWGSLIGYLIGNLFNKNKNKKK